MTFHLKSYPDALRQLFVSCTAEETNQAFDTALVRIQKNFSMPGYRKGKVPAEIIAKSNPPELMQMVSDVLTQKAYAYIEEQKTPLYGAPRFNPMSGLTKDKEFTFSLVYEVYPQITSAPQLSDIKVSYEGTELDKNFVEQNVCRQLQIFETVSGKIEEFDLVKVKITNTEYKGDKAEASFDVQKLSLLQGKKTGETISIAFDELSGYLPEFLGKVSDPLQVELVEITRPKDWKKVTDEEIAEKSPFKTKEEYFEQALKQVEGAVNQYNEAQKATALSDTLSAQIKSEIPKSLWLNNLRDLATKMAEREIVKEDISLNDLSSKKDIAEKFANLPVDSHEGLGFIIWLEELASQENLTIEPAELEFHYFRYAQSQGLPMQDFKKHLSAEVKESIRYDALREKAMQILMEKVTFTETKTIPFAEAMKKVSH